MQFFKKARNSFRLEKGIDLIAQAKYQEALEIFELILSSNTTNLLVLYNKGLALYCMKNYDESLQIFNTLLQLLSASVNLPSTPKTDTRIVRSSSSPSSSSNDIANILPNFVASAPQSLPNSPQSSESKFALSASVDGKPTTSGIKISNFRKGHRTSSSLEEKIDLKLQNELTDIALLDDNGDYSPRISVSTVEFQPSNSSFSSKSRSLDSPLTLNRSETHDLGIAIATLLARGDCFAKLGKKHLAILDYTELLSLELINTKDIESICAKGYASLRLEKFEEAHKYFDEALIISPKCVTAICGKGTVYLKNGFEHQALLYYSKVLKMNPEYREHAIDHGKVQLIVQSIQENLKAKEKKSIQEFTSNSSFSASKYETSPQPSPPLSSPISSPTSRKLQLLIEHNTSRKRLDIELQSLEQLCSDVASFLAITSPIKLEFFDEDFSEWIDLDDIQYITKERVKLKVKPVFALTEVKFHLKDITIGNHIGSGSFGEVHGGVWNGTTRVALKKLHQQSRLKDFTTEVQMLMQLRHPNIVWFYGLYCSPITMDNFIVTEFLDGGNLRDFLLAKTDLEFSAMIQMALDACAGMIYLSSHGIVHRDLSARNLLVKNEDGRFVVKVADFGLSRFVQSEYYLSTNKSPFPMRWTAPEAIKFGKFSTKSDVWSYAVTLWEILEYGAEPYYEMELSEMKEHVLKGGRLACPLLAPELLYELMLECWNEDPAKRPTFKELFDKLRSFATYPHLIDRKAGEDETDNNKEHVDERVRSHSNEEGYL
eukprot:TRINITY_DN4500_c0_g1_i1.p1 TRINITY_DN4500_c0_g1~~TRINITY_DN4500_c0_g1_i1.p1  ORF type:complete len:771 (+),score=243.63 TRINITY_DN4500_c0_g1_i1:349-2661(+)